MISGYAGRTPWGRQGDGVGERRAAAYSRVPRGHVVAGGALDAGALDAGGLGVGVLGEGVPLAEPVGVAGPPGENEGGVVGGVLDEQADTDAVASMAKAAQPRTVPRRRHRP